MLLTENSYTMTTSWGNYHAYSCFYAEWEGGNPFGLQARVVSYRSYGASVVMGQNELLPDCRASNNNIWIKTM